MHYSCFLLRRFEERSLLSHVETNIYLVICHIEKELRSILLYPVIVQGWRGSLQFFHLNQCFPIFLASAPFSDKQISITSLPCLAHISTQFLVQFTIKLNLVKR